jgi:hypothetical protein
MRYVKVSGKSTRMMLPGVLLMFFVGLADAQDAPTIQAQQTLVIETNDTLSLQGRSGVQEGYAQAGTDTTLNGSKHHLAISSALFLTPRVP